MILPLAIFILCCVGVVSMICRINHMSRDTYDSVAWQHMLMGMGFAATPVVWFLGGPQDGPALALLTLCASVVVYVLMGSRRWRHGAPPGTSRPGKGASCR